VLKRSKRGAFQRARRRKRRRLRNAAGNVDANAIANAIANNNNNGDDDDEDDDKDDEAENDENKPDAEDFRDSDRVGAMQLRMLLLFNDLLTFNYARLCQTLFALRMCY
jgi:hypothetical protein